MPIKLSILAMAPIPIIPFKARFVWFIDVIPSDGDVLLIAGNASADEQRSNIQIYSLIIWIE